MKAAVKHNISDFKDYLKSNDIYMEENIDEMMVRCIFQ